VPIRGRGHRHLRRQVWVPRCLPIPRRHPRIPRHRPDNDRYVYPPFRSRILGLSDLCLLLDLDLIVAPGSDLVMSSFLMRDFHAKELL